jgi:putative ABC transport system substrate-binding protein
VLSAGEIKRTPNATGVALELPPEVQFQWLRRFLPSAQTVGVLYNPAENSQRIAAASRVAGSMGLKLDALEVGAPRDLPAALETIGKRVDVLWGLPDSVVLTPETAKPVLLFSFRARIPLIGPSATWARAGALYALDWDYQDLGAQCGETMARVLQGASPAGIPVATPRKVLYVVNQRTAQQMKLELPETLLRNARELY